MFRISLARCSVLPLLLLLAAPAPPAAAADGPLAWVILDTLKPGKGADYVRLITENYGPTLDRMQAEGKILGWGIAEKSNADGGYTHAGWVVYPDWTAYAAVEDAFGAAFANATAEDQAKITAGFVDATEPHAHQMRYLRGVVFQFAADGPPPRYLITGDWFARPGKEAAARAVFDQARPILDRLLAEGALTGFGLYEQELHDGGSSHVTWFTCADLSAMDKFNAAFAAAGDNGQIAEQMAAAFDMSAHRDSLWQIRHLGGGGGEGGGGGGGGGK
jgi:hypothetical protein